MVFAEYASRRECVLKASESSGVASCSERLTAVYAEVYDQRRYTVDLQADAAAAAAAAATCSSVILLQFFFCNQRQNSPS